jgi:hypothetical protein
MVTRIEVLRSSYPIVRPLKPSVLWGLTLLTQPREIRVLHSSRNKKTTEKSYEVLLLKLAVINSV